MITLTINSSAPKVDRSFKGTYNLPGDTVTSLVDTFGEDVILNIIKSRLTALLGHKSRTMMENRKTTEEIQKSFDGWKPSLREASSGVLSQRSLENKLKKLETPEAKKELINEQIERLNAMNVDIE